MVSSASFRLFATGTIGKHLSFFNMVYYLSVGLCVLFSLVCASSKTTTPESFTLRDFMNGITNTSNVAVIVDLSDGNLEKVKKYWCTFEPKYDKEVTLGVINESGYETVIKVDGLQEVGPMLNEWKPTVQPNASSSDFYRYLLKTIALIGNEGRILLFTGRKTKEEPLHWSCSVQLRNYGSKLYVIWTGNSCRGMSPIRSLALRSNGSLEVANNFWKEISEEGETSGKEIPKPVTLSKMVTSDSEGFGKILHDDDDEIIQKLERIRFPEAESQEDLTSEESDLSKVNITNLFLEKQQSRYPSLIPIRVEVSSRSSLQCKPETQQEIQYDVKNNFPLPIHLQFTVVKPNNLVVTNIQYQRYTLQPLGTTNVYVSYQPSTSVADGGEGSLVFVATTEYGAVIELPTIISFKTTTSRDTSDPEVTYSYEGDCREHNKPDTCGTGQWKVTATFKDETSGLKKVLSEPYGLIFRAPFVAGTKLPVHVFYIASCCQPKIDIWAEDGQGNYVTRALDVNNQGLLLGEIAAVVLGVLFLICIIIVIIGTIIIVKRRKQNKLIIPRLHSST